MNKHERWPISLWHPASELAPGEVEMPMRPGAPPGNNDGPPTPARGMRDRAFRLEVDLDSWPPDPCSDYCLTLALGGAVPACDFEDCSRMVYWRSFHQSFQVRSEALRHRASLLPALEASRRAGYLRTYGCQVRACPHCRICGVPLPWDGADVIVPTRAGSGRIAIGQLRTCPGCGRTDLRLYGE
jgi:hypothetical protein